MKRLKFIILNICLIVSILCITACNRINTPSTSKILVGNYTLEYITDYLYGKNATIKSIYPDGSNPRDIKFTEKQIKDFAQNNLYIYLGQDAKERNLAIKLKEINKNILLIDAGLGIDADGYKAMILNPSNAIMMAKNIKQGLNGYINNNYLTKDLEEKYRSFDLKASEIDADIALTAKNATYKNLLTASNELNFLRKYGFNIINAENLENHQIREILKGNRIKYLYTLEYENEKEEISNIIKTTNLEKIEMRSPVTIKDDERNSQRTYFNIIEDNIQLLKKECFK